MAVSSFAVLIEADLALFLRSPGGSDSDGGASARVSSIKRSLGKTKKKKSAQRNYGFEDQRGADDAKLEPMNPTLKTTALTD